MDTGIKWFELHYMHSVKYVLFLVSLCLCIATDDIKGGIDMRNFVGRPVDGHELLIELW